MVDPGDGSAWAGRIPSAGTGVADRDPGLVTDPSFTYRQPVTRPDGFVANRKAAARNFQTGPDQIQSDYVFVTHMQRGPTYVGVAAIRSNLQFSMSRMQQCAPNPQIAACADLRAALRPWAQAAAAVMLATIPPI
jgi:hypothetical protein